MRSSGLIARLLDSGFSSPCSSPGWVDCVVFFRKTLNSRGVCHSTKNSGTNFRKFPWVNGTNSLFPVWKTSISLGIFQ